LFLINDRINGSLCNVKTSGSDYENPPDIGAKLTGNILIIYFVNMELK
jgi:hypothetical protein